MAITKETIGERAVKEIKKRARQNNVSMSKQASELYITSVHIAHWMDGMNPSAYYLQQMALAGYDVIYILTGVKDNG